MKRDAEETSRAGQKMTVAISCLTCAHFSLSLGEPGYSEMTPGSPPSIDCEMTGKRGCAWPRRGDYGSVEIPALITRAETCKFFEPHGDLVSATAGVACS